MKKIINEKFNTKIEEIDNILKSILCNIFVT